MEHKHPLGIIPLTASRTLQCMGHYGMRAILMIYIMEGPLSLPASQSALFYGWFTGISGLLAIFGGMLGDLLMGPRKAAITGGFMQAIGCFLLCIPQQVAIYTGLGFFALGLGLYNPNILATLALLYRNRGRMLDSAMMIFYTGVTLGALFAPLLTGLLSRELGHWTGFLASGIFLCASQLLLLLPQESLADAPFKASIYLEETHLQLRHSNILLPGFISIFIFIPLFWMIYNSCSNLMTGRMLHLYEGAEHSKSYDLISRIYIIDPVICILAGAVLAAIWAFVHVSAYLKMAIGFLIYILACMMFYLAQANGSVNTVLIFIIGGFALQTIAELFISPTANALICRYAPVRWTSTLLGAFLFLTSVTSYCSSYFLSYAESISSGIQLAVIGVILLLLAVLYLVLYLLLRSKPVIE